MLPSMYTAYGISTSKLVFHCVKYCKIVNNMGASGEHMYGNEMKYHVFRLATLPQL